MTELAMKSFQELVNPGEKPPVVCPDHVTNFERNDFELEAFCLFSLLTANKPAHRMADITNRIVEAHWFQNKEGIITALKRYELGPLKSLLKLYKTGQYNRIAGAIKRLPETKLLRTIPVEELEKIIGKKTSRFFILHSRENAECVPLDVHILRWLRIYGVNAPQNTPTTKIAYGYFEHQALRLFDLHFRGWATAHVDLHVWQTMRGMEPETGK